MREMCGIDSHVFSLSLKFWFVEFLYTKKQKKVLFAFCYADSNLYALPQKNRKKACIATGYKI